LSLAGLFFLGTWPWQDPKLKLLFASIVCLHAAHMPYWLDGMLGYHYVFESGPLWLLIFGAVSVQWLQRARERGAWLFPCWWITLVGIAVVGNLVSIDRAVASRLARGVAELTSPARGYQRFQQAVDGLPEDGPILILVRSGEEDLHVQFVRNLPPFDSRILVATDHPELYRDDALIELFPERRLFRYDAATGNMAAVQKSPLREGAAHDH
jgi:hypothetical protein